MYECHCSHCRGTFFSENKLSTWCGCDKPLIPAGKTLQQVNQDLEAKLFMFKIFADDILAVIWAGGDIDGGTAQEVAERHGLIKKSWWESPATLSIVSARRWK